MLATHAARVHHFQSIDDALDPVDRLHQALGGLLEIKTGDFSFDTQVARFKSANNMPEEKVRAFVEPC